MISVWHNLGILEHRVWHNFPARRWSPCPIKSYNIVVKIASCNVVEMENDILDSLEDLG